MLAGVLLACGTRTQLDVAHDASVHDASTVDVIDAASYDVIDEAIDACVHIDAGDFACGDAMCNSNTEYCGETIGGPAPGIDLLGCGPLPSTCNGSCFELHPPCGCEDDGGRIHITCPVP
jgi:hypothetical protein